MGLIRIFVRDFASIASPLTALTRKDSEFKWGGEEQRAFDLLKILATTTPALKAIDYNSEFETILAVDSSVKAVGFVLIQADNEGRRHPVRYGSATWTDRESRYSQAKLELYGLMRALRALRTYLIGFSSFVVEVDAQYIKGMINNPDALPNATLNRWIAYILLFSFTLRHIPAERHKAPDGLSRRDPAEGEEPETEEEVNRDLEEIFACYVTSLSPKEDDSFEHVDIDLLYYYDLPGAVPCPTPKISL
jgi:hypothetical protein